MKKGVTLIELLTVIGITTLLLAATAPISMSFYFRYQYISGYAQTASTLRTAQAKALGSEHDQNHGVYFDPASKTLTLFEGDDYTNRDQTYDFTIDLQNIALETDFGNEIVFSKLTGVPSTTGEVTISSQAGEAEIFINNEGLIN